MWFLKLKPTNDESASAFIQPRLRQKERLGELQTLRNICFPGRCLYIFGFFANKKGNIYLIHSNFF